MAIKSFGVSDLVTDYEPDFTDEKKDFMRPDGGKYVALSSDVDRSLADLNSSPDDHSKLPLEDREILAFDAARVLEEENSRIMDKQPHSIFLQLGDKKVPKRSAVRLFTDPSSDIMDGRSHDRTIRVMQLRTFSTSDGKDKWCSKKRNTDDESAICLSCSIGGDYYSAP
ncbi:hypothetical protein MPER_10716 [Moniliophthora perniciosa FA553]|nr:hypothetical protein MPER_10716 [Moniliophthora perniciosa FA553]